MGNSSSKLVQKWKRISAMEGDEAENQKVFDSGDISEAEFENGEDESVHNIDVNHYHQSIGGSNKSADFSSYDLHTQKSDSRSSSLSDHLSEEKNSVSNSDEPSQMLLEEKNQLVQKFSSKKLCACVSFIMLVDDTAFNIIPVKHMIQDKHGI